MSRTEAPWPIWGISTSQAFQRGEKFSGIQRESRNGGWEKSWWEWRSNRRGKCLKMPSQCSSWRHHCFHTGSPNSCKTTLIREKNKPKPKTRTKQPPKQNNNNKTHKKTNQTNYMSCFGNHQKRTEAGSFSPASHWCLYPFAACMRLETNFGSRSLASQAAQPRAEL